MIDKLDGYQWMDYRWPINIYHALDVCIVDVGWQRTKQNRGCRCLNRPFLLFESFSCKVKVSYLEAGLPRICLANENSTTNRQLSKRHSTARIFGAPLRQDWQMISSVSPGHSPRAKGVCWRVKSHVNLPKIANFFETNVNKLHNPTPDTKL